MWQPESRSAGEYRMNIQRPTPTVKHSFLAKALCPGDTFFFMKEFLINGGLSDVYIKTNNDGNCVNLETGFNKAIYSEDEVIPVKLYSKIVED